MNAARIIVLVLALAAAFGLGRFTAAPARQADPSTIESFRAALEERDWLTRAYGISAFLQNLNPDNLPEALEAVEGRARFVTEEEYLLFMLAWSRFDAEAAFDRALFWPDHSDIRATDAAITAWAFLDPENARLALRHADEDGGLRGRLQEGLVDGWSHRGDKRDLIEYIASLDASSRRQKYTNMLAAKIIEHEGYDAVQKWAKEIPEDAKSGYKSSVFEKAANILAAVDPPRAAQWVEDHLEHEYATDAPVLVVRRWVQFGDPAAALEWAQTLDEGKERDDAVKAAFDRWLQGDQEAAEDWLENAAPAPGLDIAVRALVRQIVKDSPGTAVEWAQRIHEPDLRHRVLVGTGNRWLFKNEAAANEWLDASELSEETKEAIRNPVEAFDEGSAKKRIDRPGHGVRRKGAKRKKR